MLPVRSKVWLFVLHVSLCIRLISNRLDWERVLWRVLDSSIFLVFWEPASSILRSIDHLF